MTPEQVHLVESSFTSLGPRSSELARLFYLRLFDAEPSLHTMFSESPAEQEALFATELAALVRSITRYDAFVTRTRELGARHVSYGVTYAHYDTAGAVLLEALADTLGADFTEELRDAWRLAFDLVAETMMQGAADAAT